MRGEFQRLIHLSLWRAHWLERIADAAHHLEIEDAYEFCARQMWRAPIRWAYEIGANKFLDRQLVAMNSLDKPPKV